MAIRPTIPIAVRATSEFYTSGDPDLVNTLTKIPRAGTDIAEGYRVDTVVSPEPVFAQEVNFEQNRNDQWVEWVSFGSAAATGNTHIVETDSSGDINVVGVNCADVRVTPDIGTDGIEVTVTGGSKGVEVIRSATSTDFGVAVTAADGAAFPNFHSQSVSSVGMEIAHGSVTGLEINATPDGGAIGPSIHMTSSAVSPTNDNVGTIWNQEQNGIDNVRMGLGSSAGYIIIAKNALCYAKSTTAVGFGLSGTPTDQQILSNFSFQAGFIPQAAALVRVVLWGKINLPPNGTNSVELKVRDKTIGGNPTILSLKIAHEAVPGATVFNQWPATFSTQYTLPASGSRSFDLVWDGQVPTSVGNFNGYVEIQEIRG